MAFAVQNLNPAWNPLNQQSIEPDTTLLQIGRAHV